MAEDLRFEILTWLFELGYAERLNGKTVQLACIYFDLFCLKWKQVTPQVVRAVAATCLMLAVKFEETLILTPDWVADKCGRYVSSSDIINLELLILCELDWDLEQPTASEVARILLGMSAPGHDFTRIMEDSDCYAGLCYPVAKLAAYGPVAIALAAVCCSFEQWKLMSFRDEWLNLVLTHTSIRKETVLDLSNLIHTHLKKVYGSDTDTDCESPSFEHTVSV